jgi:anti-anti-sigma factor
LLGAAHKILVALLGRAQAIENTGLTSWQHHCSSNIVQEEDMLKIHTEHIGNLTILECEGRIVNSESAFRLRNAVTSEIDAGVAVLDLTEVHALDGGGLGMLVFLQRWAHDHHIDLKLFNPSSSVRHRLEHASTMYEFEIAPLHQMTEILIRAEEQQSAMCSQAA